MAEPPPVALTIAGSDCCGGAGLQADLKTFSVFGVHGLTAVTSVVAETPLAVHGIYPLSPAALQQQVRILLEAYPVAAIKTGMLGSKLHVVAVAELLEDCRVPLVVDPVMVASSGDVLLPADAVDAYRSRLCPLATVVTPNLPEARMLARDGREPAAPSLASQLGCAVLLTGGHGGDEREAVDVLSDVQTVREFRGPWIETAGTHGTGCTFSAAITACLARGEDLASAVAIAKRFMTRVLRDAYAWEHPGSGAKVGALNQLPAVSFPDS